MNRSAAISKGSRGKYALLFMLGLLLGFYPMAGAAATYFSDNMDGGAANWTSQTPWALATAGTSTAWTDSPSGFYANNANASLTLATAVTLSSSSSSTTPQLVFRHKYELEAEFDYGYVEISTDGGASWGASPLASFTGVSGWKREQIDLSAYAGQSNIKIRFRLVTDKSVVMDGWTIDDVVIADLPNAVASLSVGSPLASSLTLTWNQNLDPDFASYKIYRSSAAGITTNSTLVATLSAQTTTAYTDSGLTPGATYYYKVYVVNSNNLYAASREASGTTVAGSYGFPFSDNMEGGAGGWTAASPWALTTGTDRTGATGSFWSDSPNGVPYANDVNKALTISLNLAGANRPLLRFWQRYNLESQRDFGFVEISTNNGSSWGPVYSVTGFTSTNWEEAVIDLTRWASQSIQLRFRIDADSNGTQYDGWEIDDLSVTEAPAGKTPYPFIDAFSSEASFTTNWITTNRGKEFVLTSGDGHNAAGAAYLYPPQNIPQYTPHYLILAKPIDLTGAVNPQLSFWHKYRTYSYYEGFYLHVSVDGGRNWSEVRRWSRYNTSDGTQSAWKREQIDLSAYTGLTSVLFMFQHYYGDDHDDAYWYIDDVEVTDGPNTVNLNSPAPTSGDTQHSLTLTWSVPSNPNFAQYELYRSTSAGVSRSSTLVSTITNSTVSSYVDSGLSTPGQTYYYRLWVKDVGGLYSSASNEVSAATIAFLTTASFPFSDTMESGAGIWSNVLPWALATGTDHTGATGTFWSDSPGGAPYANDVNKALTVKVSLAGSTPPNRPILRFWQRYNLESDKDFGFVEISTDSGGSWGPIYSVTGFTSTNWEEAAIDLTRWAGMNIQLRFRIDADNNGIQHDGWEIDDVTISEAPGGKTPYPFTDSFSSEATFTANWITTNKGKEFILTSSEGHTAAGAVYLYPFQNLPQYAPQYLILAKPIDLTGAVNPQLSFWHKYRTYSYYEGYYVHISLDGGRNWIEKGRWSRSNTTDGTQSTWKRVQLDLSAYTGLTNVLVMFQHYYGDDHDDAYWYVDDVEIGDGPRDVALNTPTPTTGDAKHSLTLSWTAPANPNFAQYEIYRSTSAGVSRSSTLVSTITNSTAGSFVDSGLTSPSQTYYYRIWVKDANGLYSPGSNEVYATTLNFLATATFPFSDDMESGSDYWSDVLPWSLATGTNHTGATGTYWSDSPGGVPYANDVNKALTVKLNLAGANRPILRFWQRYNLELNKDFGFVEVSTNNGGSWGPIYSVTGFTSTNWEEAAIDLTRWASQSVQLRFRIDADNNGIQYDGWEIDDISVAEAPAGKTPYPFADSFDTPEGFTANWITTNKGKEFTHTPSDGNSAVGAAYLYPFQNIPQYAPQYLILSKPIDLTGAASPQLTFWHKYRTYSYYEGYYLHISIDGGRNWIEKARWSRSNTSDGTQSTWKKETFDLSAYTGLTNVVIMFQHYYGDDHDDAYWYIDDVRIGDNESVPTYIKKISGDSQVGQTLTDLSSPFVVKVADANSNPKTGVTVDFAVIGGDGTLSASTGTSNVNGLASVTLKLGQTPGVNTASATISGSSPVQAVTFTATGYQYGQAMSIAKVSGDNQVNTVGLALSNPLVVKVVDILGNPVPEVSVSFAKVSGGGVLSAATATTNASGYAETSLTLGSTTGVTIISATSAGLIGSPVSFTAYAVLTGGYVGDTDGDGMPDEWELKYGLNPNASSDAALDADSDELTNLEEYTLGTDPTKSDTDGDGMPDKWEVQYGLNPLSAADASRDNNNNGVTNYQEFVNGTVPVALRHFNVAGVTSESMDFFGSVTIDGSPAKVGDEVAAICPGNIVCGQFTVTTAGQYGFMHVYKDDTSTSAVEGAKTGDNILFRIWDSARKGELDAGAAVVYGGTIWTANGDISNVNISGAGKQVIPLKAGWNLISFSVKNVYYVDTKPTEPMLPGVQYIKVNGIADVLSSITGSYEVVRSFDSTGVHTFDPVIWQEMGIGDLKYMAAGYGYWIKMKAAANLELSGVRAAASDKLSLRTGWNLVGYWGANIRHVGAAPAVSFPPDAVSYSVLGSLNESISSISGSYSVIRSLDSVGAHTYDPLIPDSFNTMKYMGPGYGMWIKMKTTDELSY